MHIVKRIKKKLKAWRNHVDIAEVQALSDYLRGSVFNDKTLELPRFYPFCFSYCPVRRCFV